MNPLTTFVRSMGNDGALANARGTLEVQAREDWLVQGLARRLEHRSPHSAVGSSRAADAAAAA